MTSHDGPQLSMDVKKDVGLGQVGQERLRRQPHPPAVSASGRGERAAWGCNRPAPKTACRQYE